ncbi:MAG: hypothetical protein KDA32_08930 [Phycisphaerales bacterium]|nr:hypothetical protein [Phycisphaerales bacterium]
MRLGFRYCVIAATCGLIGLSMGGCPNLEEVLSELEKLELTIDNSVNVVQTQDPRDPNFYPADFNQPIIISNNADVIFDISTDLVVEVLPDITLLGLENITGYDIYVRYFVDGVEQGVLVFDGETLLLEYPCVDLVELASEEDFDPIDGVLVDAFDLSDAFFENPFDFICGEALIITFDEFAVTATPERIDLVQ